MSPQKNRKKNYSRRAKSKQSSTPITWLISGIMIGLVIPGLFYLKSHSTKQNMTVSEAELAQVSNPTPAAIKHKTIKQTQKTHPTKNSQYEFYNLLSPSDDDGSLSKESADSMPDKFLLEIAKFNSYIEADQLKAQLLLIGFDDITISKSTNGNHPVYKVTAGPFNSRAQASKAQQQLKDNSIDASIIVG